MGTRTSSKIFTLVAVLVTGALLAGCSQGDGHDRAASGDHTPSAGASVTPAQPSASPSGAGPGAGTTEPGRSSTGKAGQSGEVTVTGQVEAGVEGGCLVLRTPSKLYLLVGGDPAKLVGGRRVTVRGRPEPDMVTTCQQGTPLRVIEVRPA